MKTHFEVHPKVAFEWFVEALTNAPFCYVEPTGRSKGKCHFICSHGSFDLPEDPGIYVVYPKERNDPIYAGEGRNIRNRVKYHFSESESAKKYSTLKKKLRKKGFAADAPTHELVRFKFVIVPFGRKEIEELFHAQHGINTREKRGKLLG